MKQEILNVNVADRAIINYHLNNYQEAFRFKYYRLHELALILLHIYCFGYAVVTEDINMPAQHHLNYNSPCEGSTWSNAKLTQVLDQAGELAKLLRTTNLNLSDQEITDYITLTELLK